MEMPNGIKIEDVETVKFYANEILKIADEINTDIFSQVDKNQELLFDAWQSEKAKEVSSAYEEMKKSFEKYYNYLNDSFEWIHGAASKISSADKEIEQSYVSTIDG